MIQNPTQAIRDLATSSNMQRTKISRIRELLPEIEQAQAQGVRLDMIVVALTGAGFPEMDIKSLQNLLYQARRSKGGKKKRQSISQKSIDKVGTTSAAKPVNMGNGGIDAEGILGAAIKAVQSNKASELTLSILRSSKSTNHK